MNAQVFRDTSHSEGWSAPLARWLADWRRSRRNRLDPDSLSDHMRRDLGLLGGREPPVRNPLRD